MMNLKKIFSFIYPIKEKVIKNEFHQLELEWYQGKLMLNTKNANYSFGNLQKVFENVFIDSNLHLQKDAHVLLLGLGGGSVIHLLEKKYQFEGTVTAVDFDPDIIEIYKSYFQNKNQSQAELNCIDAEIFINNASPEQKYDLIICDLFIDLSMPAFTKQPAFYQKIKTLLQPKSRFYINHIGDQASASELYADLWPLFPEVNKYAYFNLNQVFVAKMP